VELKTIGRLALEPHGKPRAIVHPLADRLAIDDMPADAAFTVEIDLSWQADPGSTHLALSDVPTANQPAQRNPKGIGP
jgi:hypothetical protein